MYNTREELQEKINELMGKVEALPTPKTDNIGILEIINQYIVDNSKMSTIKRCIVSIFAHQGLSFNHTTNTMQGIYPMHNKTSKQHLFSAYLLALQELSNKNNSNEQTDIDKVYEAVISNFLLELEQQIAIQHNVCK